MAAKCSAPQLTSVTCIHMHRQSACSHIHSQSLATHLVRYARPLVALHERAPRLHGEPDAERIHLSGGEWRMNNQWQVMAWIGVI